MLLRLKQSNMTVEELAHKGYWRTFWCPVTLNSFTTHQTMATDWTAEYTDTFGGEANYSWVKREDFTMPDDATDRQIVIAGKESLGLTGVRCHRSTYDEGFQLRPINTNTVAFILPKY